MTSNYKLKLFFVLLLSATIITFSISIIDYYRLKEKTVEETQFQIDQAANTVAYALKTVDKAYYLLDKDIAPKMEENTKFLQDKYEENPNFESWDFASLSNSLGMDIYIVNDTNKIEYSNVSEEIGLDFSTCCKTLSRTLDERRKTGQLYIDGIDIDQKNGEVKKFSYMATSDKKYIIELGYSLQNEVIFEHFNFLTLIDELIDDFPLISDINVLNFGGRPYGVVSKKLEPPERREAFELARETGEIIEIENYFQNEEAIYRYVPLISEYDAGVTKMKVIEIIYNKDELNGHLNDMMKKFLIQLAIISIITIFVSSLIASWFAKPVYLAFHDSLTGLKNRAAFDDYLKKSLKDKSGITAFLMMDLDNFKLANDSLGHREGDNLLQIVSRELKQIAIENNSHAFRLGGDEFAVILTDTNRKEVHKIAQHIIKSLENVLHNEKDIYKLSITVSIGIALSTENQSMETLYKEADTALYESKEKGKNQYQIFGDEIKT